MTLPEPSITVYLNRKTGRWHANVYWADTKTRFRPSLGVNADEDPAAALEAFKAQALPELIRRHATEPAPEPKNAAPRIGDLATWYLDVHLPYVGVAHRTEQKYRQVLHDFELFCRARKLTRIDQVNMARIQEFIQWFESETGKPRAVKTRHTAIGTLRAWLNACVDASQLEAAPVRKWIMPRLPEPTPHALSRAQLDALLVAVQVQDPEIYPLILLMAWTGLRPSDAINLRWANVHEARLSLRQQKTGRSWQIPLTPQTRQALKLAGQRGTGEDFVFQTVNGQPWADRTLLRRLQAAAQAGEVAFAVHLKLLRTTFATMLARAGCNPKLHQTLLGHARLETTLRYYTDVDDHMADDFMRKFSQEPTTENAQERVNPRRP